MDKSDGSKKRGPASTSRRTYSLFGGIINLAQSHTKSNDATSATANASSGGTTPDPQGSSNVYTVTVNNSRPTDYSTNQAKTYENVALMKKKKGDQSPSAVSSLTNSGGMSTGTTASGSSSSSSGPIGPAPRTLSILTALNELAISDEIGPNPTSSTRPPPVPSSSSRGSASNTSKTNPTHSSSNHPSKRSSHVPSNAQGNSERGSIQQQQQHQIPPNAASSSSASLHHSPSTVYHSPSKGIYNNPSGTTTITNSSNSNARLKGYSEPPRRTLVSSSASTLPSTLRAAHKSLGDHKETPAQKAAVKKRDSSKSRTPDWIWKIFQLTKHGRLEELQQSLLGLDSTLIRHLADAKGNTVLHSAVRGGHVNTLQWLVSVLGPQCTEAALNDHNQTGRTVILTALKKGQLPCLQWLVHHTKCGEKALVPNEGERSLLHFAATYGDVNVVRWLCTELIEKGIGVDIRDAGGMTPLHDAAKSGHITVCHELILAGADPLSQTELGWRPSDLAIRHRHMECASYFIVAEAAGSLGNQLHSLLLAFNHLRQEHEELRSHFRETLRVGRWLAKERNDVIKHFPSKWTPEATSSLLLGGTNNGARFSDLEHKLGLAEQAWKKLSQNPEDAGDAVLNGEEALHSSGTSHEFLQRLAALQLRHERNQGLGNSLSGSSDEDQHEENSSSDASSSDVNVERVTSLPAGSGAGGNSAAIIHSSNVSPPQMEARTMKTRSKAAPWLLPPNDVFLSQLSPFVGAHGRSLPTLDLLHGAPTSPSLLSPIVTQSSVPPTTDGAGKNEKSLAQQMDGEPHHGSSPGKRDSTSLDVSVLEVIEPSSSTSPSSCKKKREDGVEQFHVSSRPWLDFSDQTKGMLRSLPKCVRTNLRFGIGGDESSSGRKSALLVMPTTSEVSNTDAYYSGSEGSTSSWLASQRHGELDGQLLAKNVSRLAAQQQQQCDEYDLEKVTRPNSASNNTAHHPKHAAIENVHQAPDLICGTHYRSRVDHRDKLQQQPREGYPNDNLLRSSSVVEQMEDVYGSVSGRVHLLKSAASSSDEMIQRADLPCQSSREGEPRSNHVAKVQQQQQQGRHSSSPSTSFSIQSAVENKKLCLAGDSTSDIVTNDAGDCGGGAATKSRDSLRVSSDLSVTVLRDDGSCNLSKSRTPSPKSYVTELTVIPVEATTKTCFLSVKSPLFVREDLRQHQLQPPSHQLQLPGENQDELSLGLLQVPSDSVSSSNTPVMPRFNSSGTVVFPPRKPDWHYTELLSLTTPDSSLAGRLSPTPSESSRTESALAPPPSYVSHASQNSEASKTESARGQSHHEEVDAERDLESPGVAGNYINEDSHCECSHSPILESEEIAQNDPTENTGERSTADNPESFEMCAGGSTKPKDYSNSKEEEDDDGDNDGAPGKQCRVFGNQRIQARTCFIRYHLSTSIHKTSAQRLPKDLRGKSKPWYEIEGSDDERSLLRVAKSRSNQHSSRYTTSSSSQSSHTEGESSGNESERNRSSSKQEEEENEQKEHHSNHDCSKFL